MSDMVKDNPLIEGDLKQIYVKLDAIQEQLKTLTSLVNGNGDPSHGLIVRVDRLEQWRNQVTWFLVLIGGSLILQAINLAWDLLSHSVTIAKP